MIKYILLLCLTIISMPGLTIETEVSYEVKGTVAKSQYIEAQKKEGHDPAVDNVMGSMFGILGDIVSNVLSTDRSAYYTYIINTEDARIFEVSSRTKFNINDCVVVIYPKLPGGYPESRIDSDTKLKSSENCVSASISN